MTKEEMITAVNSIKQPSKEKKIIFQIAKELGLNFKETSCSRCLRDYLNILKEELGIIGNAAEKSDFNTTDDNVEYRFIHSSGGVYWKGRRYTQDTPIPYIKHFLKYFPKGYYEVVEKKEETTIPQQEETINNNE